MMNKTTKGKETERKEERELNKTEVKRNDNKARHTHTIGYDLNTARQIQPI